MVKLVKTTGGNSGTPCNCTSCGGSNFIRAGMAWSCGDCGLYIPAELSNPHKQLQSNLNQLTALHSKLKMQIAELERLVLE